ncbi:MAG: hypothetical protein DMG39_12510 [Acidobacteria bacterium]|nr:MAG: hypothetical protein DMG39_12510 [Acidobacteriota bacterium]
MARNCGLSLQACTYFLTRAPSRVSLSLARFLKGADMDDKLSRRDLLKKTVAGVSTATFFHVLPPQDSFVVAPKPSVVSSGSVLAESSAILPLALIFPSPRFRLRTCSSLSVSTLSRTRIHPTRA